MHRGGSRNDGFVYVPGLSANRTSSSQYEPQPFGRDRPQNIASANSSAYYNCRKPNNRMEVSDDVHRLILAGKERDRGVGKESCRTRRDE
jgi:hypothetical protein